MSENNRVSIVPFSATKKIQVTLRIGDKNLMLPVTSVSIAARRNLTVWSDQLERVQICSAVNPIVEITIAGSDLSICDYENFKKASNPQTTNSYARVRDVYRDSITAAPTDDRYKHVARVFKPTKVILNINDGESANYLGVIADFRYNIENKLATQGDYVLRLFGRRL